MDRQQSYLVIILPGFSLFDKRRYLLDCIISICNHMSGPLFSYLRDKKGLTYSVGLISHLGISGGYLAFYGSTETNRIDRLLENYIYIIDELSKGLRIDRKVFEDIKESLSGASKIELDSGRARVENSASTLLFYNDPFEYERLSDIYHSLKFDDFLEVLRSLLDINKASFGVVGKKKPLIGAFIDVS